MRFLIERIRQARGISQRLYRKVSGLRRPIARLQVERLESRWLLALAINEFPVPTANSAPLGITAGPDGNLWFTESNSSKIGQINPTTHAIVEFPTPSPHSRPLGLTVGPDGNIWFTEQTEGDSEGQIGEINPTTHVIAEFGLPGTNRYPSGITGGPDGNIWFTEINANMIGEINPATHAITEFPIPTANSLPFGIAAGPDGNIWFTEGGANANKIGMISPSTHVIAEFPVLRAMSQPDEITAGPDGNLWFTESRGNNIAMINPTTHAVAEFPTPTAGSDPIGITRGPDGNLWFTEISADQIGSINPTTHAVAEFPVPNAQESLDQGITTGPDGNIWFPIPSPNVIGQAVLTAAPTAPDLALAGTAPSSVTPGSSVTYTLTVTNNGTAEAVGVTLTDTLPPGATFVSAAGGVTPVSGVLTFTIGSLAAGARASVAIVVTSTATGTLNNQASVVGSQSDPTPGDNSVAQTTTVSAGLTVTGVERFGFHAQATTLVLTFDAQLDPRRAAKPGNYQILALDGPRRVIRVRNAVYNATARTVTLSLERRLNLHKRFRLTVIGTGPSGLTDVAGNVLQGQRNGDPGSDFVTIVTAADLVLTTRDPSIVRAYQKILASEGLHLRQPVQISAAKRLIVR
jgi:uncharacterized repeat protein (TIGR01451 family)